MTLRLYKAGVRSYLNRPRERRSGSQLRPGTSVDVEIVIVLRIKVNFSAFILFDHYGCYCIY